MNLYCYIDDTSNSGNDPAFEFLDDVEKGYIGFIADDKLLETLRTKIEKLKKRYSNVLLNIKNQEFHFVDIYNSDKITSKQKIDIFRDFSNLIEKNYVCLFSQSYRKNFKTKITIDNKEINDSEEVCSLILLFKQIKDFMKEAATEYKFFKAYVTIDDGMNKSAKDFLKTDYNHFKGIALSTSVDFKASCDDIFVQLADFCAYCYTRQQYLAKALINNQTNGKTLDKFKKTIYDFVTKVMHHV